MFWWLAMLSVVGAADLVFRVPEVMVRHAGADRPVGIVGGSSGSNGSNGGSYQEYFIEHSVSTADARKAAVALDLRAQEWGGAVEGCGRCGRRERRYCESAVLWDHCCCERRYVSEPFPWLPHECLAGADRCRPTATDCAQYARLRDCCCRTQMAHKWKSILSGCGARVCGRAAVLVTALAAILLGTRMRH